MAQAPAGPKTSFKAPEGRWGLHSERGDGCAFAPGRPVRLTLACLAHQGAQHTYLLHNIVDALSICFYAAIDKPPTRQVLVGGGGSGGQAVVPTCHDHAASPDGLDLVIGLSSGDVVVGSLKAQLQAAPGNTRLLSLLHFNPEGCLDGSRCVRAAWLPGTNAGLFAAAHASGCVYLYQTQAAASPADASRAGKAAGGSGGSGSGGAAAVPKPALVISACAGGLTAMAVSPDGTKVAVASKGGLLLVHDLATGALLTGFKAHYAGLCCCAWSHDSLYVATGGEDDLVCVFGLTEAAVVWLGEGHASWVTGVAFDRWESEQSGGGGGPAAAPQQTRYRLGSVGQDCQLLLWDFTVEEDEFFVPGLPAEPRHEQAASGERPIHRRAPSNPSLAGLADGKAGEPAGSSGRQQRPVAAAGPLPPEVRPPLRRAEMCFSPPIVAQAVHGEPCCDLLFMKEALYTACFTGQIRCWRRPEREAARSQAGSPPDGSANGSYRSPD